MQFENILFLLILACLLLLVIGFISPKASLFSAHVGVTYSFTQANWRNRIRRCLVLSPAAQLPKASCNKNKFITAQTSVVGDNTGRRRLLVEEWASSMFSCCAIILWRTRSLLNH